MRLIDADILKEAFIVNTDRKGYLVADPEVIIDNAPTVEPRIEFGTDGQPYRLFMTGGQVVPDNLQGWRYEERPQGEWEESHIYSCGKILRMGMNVIEHKCKNCGRWSIKWERTIPDNFCSNCGAGMRGKENAKT